MRVIAGNLRSRPLAAPVGQDTRPTADRLRETLFNILTQGATDHVQSKAFLDLYAGSGAVGIEALSRGATHVTFVESGPPALAILKKNLDTLNIRTGFSVEKRSVAAFLKRETRTYNAIFLDPPYDKADEYSNTLNLLGGDGAHLLAADAIVIAEHRKKQPLAEQYGNLTRIRTLAQGDAALSLYSVVVTGL
ncbi:16S rRNA (guanine(966)-N(2))-methyltransferase RsmD [Acidicapsa ligni]|uniref:16S rRNA (guanine(966)-N(2))-methyltransferase RsmD n=1 Tax=Acidicapsa ligni TaxID=542300 RepID=UPI0021E00B1B|nr:16S rRNA (guanine(966)-N(2))-methyltransferase RsmD [Acidicapsa ligni]